MKILSALQMAEVDRLTTKIYQIPSLLLMESAGRAVADHLETTRPDLTGRPVHIFCGKGNNGGDGLVLARYLFLRGGRPEVFLFSDPAKLRGDAFTNWQIVRSLGLPTQILPTMRAWSARAKTLPRPAVIADALLGTGLSKPIGKEFRLVVDWINASEESYVVSVDIPSGLFADSSLVPGPVVRADLTVTFTALKLALIVPPAAEFVGKLVVSPIGSPSVLLENPEYRLDLIDTTRVRRALPTRPRASHKGSFGHVFVVAGSRGKSGAALMAGLASLRSGAGLVTLWLPKSLHSDVVGKVPELMTEWLPETDAGTADLSGAERLVKESSEADVVVIGPGLTTNARTRELVRLLVRRSPIPVVLDADGINAFAGRSHELRNDAGNPVVITPHPGEMARLLGITIARVQGDRLQTARKYAEEQGVFVVLKGFETILATPSAGALINPTGNPGMASAGTGDILAGMTARFLAGWVRRYRGVDFGALADYLSAAIYLHGLAGDLAAQDKGMESMVATDILEHLPAAFRQVLRG